MREVDVYYTNSKGNKENLNESSTFELTINLTKAGGLPYIDSELIEDTRNISGYNGFNNDIEIGTVGKLLLTNTSRSRYNNLNNYVIYDDRYKLIDKNNLIADLGEENIIKSISSWDREYRLPSTSTFVLKGGDAKNIIKEDGYVIVYFEIKTNNNNVPYLSYQKSTNST